MNWRKVRIGREELQLGARDKSLLPCIETATHGTLIQVIFLGPKQTLVRVLDLNAYDRGEIDCFGQETYWPSWAEGKGYACNVALAIKRTA